MPPDQGLCNCSGLDAPPTVLLGMRQRHSASSIPSPVPPGGPAHYNPIHEDDIVAIIPKLLEVASVPVTTVNWAGNQTVSRQEWCRYLGSLISRETCWLLPVPEYPRVCWHT
jgi:hypothetical protein